MNLKKYDSVAERYAAAYRRKKARMSTQEWDEFNAKKVISNRERRAGLSSEELTTFHQKRRINERNAKLRRAKILLERDGESPWTEKGPNGELYLYCDFLPAQTPRLAMKPTAQTCPRCERELLVNSTNFRTTFKGKTDLICRKCRATADQEARRKKTAKRLNLQYPQKPDPNHVPEGFEPKHYTTPGGLHILEWPGEKKILLDKDCPACRL